MYIKAETPEGIVSYLNSDHYTRFTVGEKEVEAWTPDNLTISLKKTKELKEGLEKLLGASETSKGFEKFK